jgi:peroxiredoxin Q/BCP
MALKTGDFLPHFELKDQDGELFKVADLIGKHHILIYFYPKDESPGCTTEACTFRDNMQNFDDLNCKVIGISRDKPSRHKRFAENHQLPYTLLSDHRKEVRKLFGVKDVIRGVMPGRKTYLVNLEGKISHIFEYQFQPKKHVLEPLLVLQK